MMRLRLMFGMIGLVAATQAGAQQLPDEGQSESAYHAFLAAKPHVATQVREFEAWLRRKRVHDIVPTWQMLRTATMWRQCVGPPFEVPPRKLWPNVAATLRFVRDHVVSAVGRVEAVSAYRNPALNRCAGGSAGSAHRDYSALDLVPAKPLDRRRIFMSMCRVHRHKGPARGVGLGFYAFTRFHIDTRSFRRWGSAGPMGNESPCALVERGEDPLTAYWPGAGNAPQDGGGGARQTAPSPASPPLLPPPPRLSPTPPKVPSIAPTAPKPGRMERRTG